MKYTYFYLYHVFGHECESYSLLCTGQHVTVNNTFCLNHVFEFIGLSGKVRSFSATLKIEE